MRFFFPLLLLKRCATTAAAISPPVEGGLVALFVTAAAFAAAPPEAPLVVYAYDSFTGKGSLAERVTEETVRAGHPAPRYVTFGSAGEALNQVVLDGARGPADLVVGIDRTLWPRAKEMAAFATNARAMMAGIPRELLFDEAGTVVPFDYGYLSFVYDSRRRPAPPAGLRLAELARLPALAKRVALEDPRTSSLGLAFLVGTHRLFAGGAFEEFWRGMSKQWLAISPGWSGAYGLFLKQEADLVLSYTTSPAYHLEKEKNDAIRALIFPEGNFRQVEGAAILKTSRHQAAARDWLRALLSPAVQTALPLRQWMYPVREVSLPKSFAGLPKVVKALDLDPPDEKTRRRWLEQWVKLTAGG